MGAVGGRGWGGLEGVRRIGKDAMRWRSIYSSCAKLQKATMSAYHAASAQSRLYSIQTIQQIAGASASTSGLRAWGGAPPSFEFEI